MPAKYERLPTEPQLHNPSFATYYPPPYYENVVETSDSNPDIEQEAPRRSRARHRGDPLPSFDSDPRFRQPTPSPYVRALLLLFTAFLFWLAFDMRRDIWVESGMGMGKNVVEEVDPSY